MNAPRKGWTPHLEPTLVIFKRGCDPILQRLLEPEWDPILERYIEGPVDYWTCPICGLISFDNGRHLVHVRLHT